MSQHVPQRQESRERQIDQRNSLQRGEYHVLVQEIRLDGVLFQQDEQRRVRRVARKSRSTDCKGKHPYAFVKRTRRATRHLPTVPGNR
ncbi:hypothetical protein CesoFtcFv8_025582 [Champsocephalus esox]|uniref:Uncharacterized protein n=1 Tax=Champsocephalus esox TaxID=159716 RepID=A0AAN8B4G6_9TELE|nr:hypothetical protein CesoFtcFv8_025582 [Champsocephalus esox]